MAALFLVLSGVVLRETVAIKVEEVRIEIPGLPAGLDGFRMVQLTDLHGRGLPLKVMRVIEDYSPHLIALTGDYVSSSLRDMERITPFLRALSDIAPTYAVSGNHDFHVGWPSIRSALRAQGVVVLENEHLLVRHREQDLVLVGVDDPATGRDNLRAALPPLRDDQTTVIVLAHAPTWFELNRTELLKGVDLVLSGHTHGGQIKLPFIGAVTNASGRLFPQAYVDGLSHENGTWLYISRGLGYTGIPIRFMSRPEITLVTLTTPK
jgi:predicted MPP superfamily phosphohydrolase